MSNSVGTRNSRPLITPKTTGCSTPCGSMRKFQSQLKYAGGSDVCSPAHPPASASSHGAAITQITVTSEPIATSIYATEDIPASAVETMTKAAIRYVPICAEMVSG